MHPFHTKNKKDINGAYLDLLVNGTQKDSKFGRNSIYDEIARLELKKRGMETPDFNGDNFRESIQCIYDRIDCFDFVLPGFIFMMSRYGESGEIPEDLKNEARDMILGCKYWIDEGGPENSPCYFTENHQMLFHANEYAAGQLYPDETFTNNGKSGKWHMEHAKPLVLNWLEWRFRFGFSEWLSNNYYHEDMLSVSLLAILAEDDEIRTKACMIIDLLFFDMALNSYKGNFGSTHGRTYCRNIVGARDGSHVLRGLFLGIGDQPLTLSPAAVFLACDGYKAEEPIVSCANDPRAYENRQVMSMNVEEGAALGVDPGDPKNVTYFWGMGANSHEAIVDNTINIGAVPGYYMVERAKSHKEYYDMCDAAGIQYDPDADYTSRPKADLYTYRTDDYMLSCAQDNKKGKYGFQQHVWQATLGGKAVVFTNHPATDEYNGRPNKWAGNRIMPKTVCHKNVLISMHNINVAMVPTYTYHTHAYIPQEFLDEVITKDKWVFGRKGDGYFAIRPLSGFTSWEKPDPAFYPYMDLPRKDEKGGQYEIKPYEYTATGRSNAWICEMGSKNESGSFGEFAEAVSAAEISGDVFSLTYHSPSLGRIETGWSKPLKVSGQNIPVDYQMRYENPWCNAKRGALQMSISDGERELRIDFEKASREVR